MPKNRFSRHISSIFGRKKSFYKVRLRHFLGIAILHLCAKNQQKIMSQPREKQKIRKWSKGISPKTKIRNLRRKKIFQENFFRPYIRVRCTLSSCQKSEKTNEAILYKAQKTYFQAVFGPNLPKKNFLSKIGLRHFLGIAILHLCAKNQKKLMSQSREKLVTDERTDDHE